MDSKFIRGSFTGMADQVWLSLIRFLINIILIRFADKVAYGLFVQFFAIIELSMSVQNAIFLSPLLTLAPKKSPGDCSRSVIGLFAFQFLLLILFAVGSLVAMVVYSKNFGYDHSIMVLILFLLLAIIGVWKREFMRNYFFLKRQVHKVLVLDFIYGLFILFGLGLVWFYSILDISKIFIVISVSNLLSFLLASSYLRKELFDKEMFSLKNSWNSLRESWAYGRWALPSSVLVWANSSVYIYVASLWGGAAAAAELSAARLLLMPMGLIFKAWKKNYRPYAGILIAENNYYKMFQVSMRSLFILIAIVVAYVLFLVGTYGWLETALLGAKYQGLSRIVIFWGIITLLGSLKVVGNSALLSAGYFRKSFQCNSIASMIGFTAMIIGTLSLGIPGTLASMVLIEVLVVVMIWSFLFKTLFAPNFAGGSI